MEDWLKIEGKTQEQVDETKREHQAEIDKSEARSFLIDTNDLVLQAMEEYLLQIHRIDEDLVSQRDIARAKIQEGT